jgi:hypothetical protein
VEPFRIGLTALPIGTTVTLVRFRTEKGLPVAAQEQDRQLYLKRAAELRDLAAVTHFPEIKSSLLKIARQYERLAKDQGRFN